MAGEKHEESDLTELIQKKPHIKEQWSRECDDELFLELSKQIPNSGLTLALSLGLTNADAEQIKRDKHDEKDRIIATLIKWREKNGSDATYQVLIEIFSTHENRKLAEFVINYLDENVPRKQTSGTIKPLVFTIFGLVIAIILITSGCVALGLAVSPTNTTKHDHIGQDPFNSPSLIKLNSSISFLTIHLIEPTSHIRAMVYIDSTTPSMNSVYLQSSPSPTLTCSGSQLAQPSRCNYNYNGADIPIYLLADFKLIYKLSIRNNNMNINTTPTKLLLFNNWSQYRNYFAYKSYNPCNTSKPLQVGNGTAINSTWTFNITEPSFYYVALEVAYNVTVTSYNVSVAGQLYNISGLESPCSKPLSEENPHCEVFLCNKFYCNQHDMYLLIDSNSNVSVTYHFISSKIDGKADLLCFIFGLLLLLTFVYCLCWPFVYCLWWPFVSAAFCCKGQL